MAKVKDLAVESKEFEFIDNALQIAINQLFKSHVIEKYDDSLLKIIIAGLAYNVGEQDLGPIVASFELDQMLKEDVLLVVKNNLNDIKSIVDVFSKDYLLSYFIKQRTSIFIGYTRETKYLPSLVTVAEQDHVLVISEDAPYLLTELAEQQANAKLTTVEHCSDSYQCTAIKNAALGNQWTITTNELETLTSKKWQKIYLNTTGSWTFTSDLQIYVESLNILKNTANIAEHDAYWLASLAIVENLAEDGQAVMVIDHKELLAHEDNELQRYLLENGYIEAVITLPTTKQEKEVKWEKAAVILSKGNQTIKMVHLGAIEMTKQDINDMTAEAFAELLHHANDTEWLRREVTRSEIEEFNHYDTILSPVAYTKSVPPLENGRLLSELTIENPSDLEPTMIKSFKELYEFEEYVTAEELFDTRLIQEYRPQMVTKDTIVFGRTNRKYKECIHYVKVPAGETVALLGDGLAVQINAKLVEPAYVFAYLNSEAGQKQIATAVDKEVLHYDPNNSHCRQIEIPLVSREKQITLAQAYLADLDIDDLSTEAEDELELENQRLIQARRRERRYQRLIKQFWDKVLKRKLEKEI